MSIEQYRISEAPFYRSIGQEKALFTAAASRKIPVMIKGPTGCGKTRFVEHMAWTLGQPLVSVSCHEDMTAPDLVGRFLLDPSGTVWADGPLTEAVRHGAICYLDEIVEARQDTTVVIHSLTDDRRMLALEKKGELVRAHPDFHLVISYNPGYQSVVKDLKESTKQRFCAIDFGYPEAAIESEIVQAESGVDSETAMMLVRIGSRSRHLQGHGLTEGASTRMLIHAAQMVSAGAPLTVACEMALVLPITDDADMRKALTDAIEAMI